MAVWQTADPTFQGISQPLLAAIRACSYALGGEVSGVLLCSAAAVSRAAGCARQAAVLLRASGWLGVLSTVLATVCRLVALVGVKCLLVLVS
jgi:hypothetical protein